MTDHANVQRKSLIADLDSFVFVKNGYSVWIHLIPFAIAALLLLILSVPTDNLLLNLVKVLQQPSWIWLPAGLLTAVAAAVYIVTVNVQIRQAYLWSKYNLRRTIGTSLTYIFLCMLMAYVVLLSVSSHEKTTLGDIWACLLVAVLSLTGIGWLGPSSWVKSISVKSPNYMNSHRSVKKLTEILQCVRTKSSSDKQDVEDFLSDAENLRSSIETNLQLEPKWAKYNLQIASNELYTLRDKINEYFPTNNDLAVKDFAAACKYQKQHQYQEFIETLKTLSKYWSEWEWQEDPNSGAS
jgi:hypothetical protein